MGACASQTPEEPAGAPGQPGLPAAEGRRVLLPEGPGGLGLSGSWQAGAAEGAVWQQLTVAGPVGPRGPCTRHGGCHLTLSCVWGSPRALVLAGVAGQGDTGRSHWSKWLAQPMRVTRKACGDSPAILGDGCQGHPHPSVARQCQPLSPHPKGRVTKCCPTAPCHSPLLLGRAPQSHEGDECPPGLAVGTSQQTWGWQGGAARQGEDMAVRCCALV